MLSLSGKSTAIYTSAKTRDVRLAVTAAVSGTMTLVATERNTVGSLRTAAGFDP
jgi:hypothetical protein